MVLLLYHIRGFVNEHTLKMVFDAFICSHVQYKIGSDYFTENFQLRENKTRMRNIHPRFFHLLF